MEHQLRPVMTTIVTFLLLLSLAGARIARAAEEAIDVPADSKACVACHGKQNPGIVDHWKGSGHARSGVGCLDCHAADAKDADAFSHYGKTVATVVTPMDCSG